MSCITDQKVLAQLRKKNNPNNEATGRFTGRCDSCGSNYIRSKDNSSVCDGCGATFHVSDMPIRHICNVCLRECRPGDGHSHSSPSPSEKV